jgi:hypothetical protein
MWVPNIKSMEPSAELPNEWAGQRPHRAGLRDEHDDVDLLASGYGIVCWYPPSQHQLVDRVLRRAAISLADLSEFCTDPQRNPENCPRKYLERVPSRGPPIFFLRQRTPPHYLADPRDDKVLA